MKDLPQEKNWDYFWKLNTESRFTQKSWSKIRIIRVLDEIIKPEMVVLDAGSGSGFFSNYFLSKGCKVYSLDYSKDALEITKRLTNNKSEAYLQEDLLDPFLSQKYENTFDMIFSDGLFEHFSKEDQRKIMDNFRKVKKSDGIIATFVPNKYSWWEIVRPLVMPGIKEDPFTMPRLLALHQGLVIIKKGGLNTIPLRFSPDKLVGGKIGMILYLLVK